MFTDGGEGAPVEPYDQGDDEVGEQEHKETRPSLWAYYFHLLAIIACLAVLALVVLGTHAIYHSYSRGEDKREAQNDTRIQRERLVQDALRQYGQTR